MTRKTTNPRLIALRDRAYDRWFARMRRAVTVLDKLRRQMARLSRQIAAEEEPART
jgi:hypothetical protein